MAFRLAYARLMSDQSPVVSPRRLGIAVVAALSGLALGIAAILSGVPDMPFGNYFGPIRPFVATLIVVAVAALAHWVLMLSGAFSVIRTARLRRGLAIACVAGPLFAVPTILADVAFRFPADINAPFPGALLFYPLMGYVAETAFHLVPLAVLLLLARAVAGQWPGRGLVRLALVIVALVEPLAQASGTFNAATPAALDYFMLVHLTVFSLALLALYRRYGFLTAFAFRLAYYLVWHILWGVIRLSVVY